jgi:glucose uptake protein
VKGILIAVLSGLLLSGFYPLLAWARAGEVGLGPYAVCAVFALGIFFSTFVFNLFFMNLPVEGEPVDFLEYFRASPKSHGFAVLGGVVWCCGAVAAYTAASAENVRISAALSYGFSQGPALVAMLWGVLAWKEFKDGDARTRSLLWVLFILFAMGILLVSVSQAPAVHAA